MSLLEGGNGRYGARWRLQWLLAVLVGLTAMMTWLAQRGSDEGRGSASSGLTEATTLLMRHGLVPHSVAAGQVKKLARKAGPEALSRVFIDEAGASNADALRWLVDAGAQPGRASLREQQAGLFGAATRYPWDSLAYLLAQGWSPAVRDDAGRSLLHHAVAAGANAATVRLLVNKGLSPKARSAAGRTPLHESRAQSVPGLVAVGAELDAADDAGLTALHLAVIDNRTDMVAALLAAGASVHAVDRRGRTALHLAYLQRNQMAVEKLEAAGAPRAARDADGLTPSEMRPR